MGSFIALTNNAEVNAVLAQRASEEFSLPRTFAVLPDNFQENGISKGRISAAFINQVPIKTWNGYLTEGQVKLGKTTLKDAGLSFQQAHIQALINTGEILPLLVRRNKRLQIVKATEQWQAEDEILYLLHDPRPKLLKQLSGAIQSSRLVLEKLQEVEEVPLPGGEGRS
jgi:Trk K+ transport system NAD-binding subunit